MKNHALKVAFFVFAIMFTSAVESFSQDPSAKTGSPYPPPFGDIRVGLAPVIIGNLPGGPRLGASLYGQVYLSEYLSIDADLCVARNYFHGGPGIIGIPAAIIFLNNLSNNEEDAEDNEEGSEITGESVATFLILAAIALLSFEHLSGHIPVKNDLYVSPYISILRYRSLYPVSGEFNSDRDPEGFCFALGISLDKYFGRFVLSPYAEYNLGYDDMVSGFIAGVNFSLVFPRKR